MNNRFVRLCTKPLGINVEMNQCYAADNKEQRGLWRDGLRFEWKPCLVCVKKKKVWLITIPVRIGLILACVFMSLSLLEGHDLQMKIPQLGALPAV